MVTPYPLAEIQAWLPGQSPVKSDLTMEDGFYIPEFDNQRSCSISKLHLGTPLFRVSVGRSGMYNMGQSLLYANITFLKRIGLPSPPFNLHLSECKHGLTRGSVLNRSRHVCCNLTAVLQLQSLPNKAQLLHHHTREGVDRDKLPGYPSSYWNSFCRNDP